MNLTYFKDPQKLNPRQARWALYLFMFNYRLRHIPGARLGKADALSRINQNVSEEGGELPMEETLLPPDVFIQAIKNLESVRTDL